MRRFLLWTGGIVAVVVVGLAVAWRINPRVSCAAPPALLAALLPEAKAACARSVTPDTLKAARTPLPPAVTVTRAETREFVDRLFVSGTLVARDEAMVGAQIDGLRIIEILADDGDTVVKGQVLARLDRSQLDALLAQSDAALQRAAASIEQAKSQIAQFEAALAQAQADLDRARKLDVQIVTQAVLDQRIAAFRGAQAQLQAAKSALAVAQADKAAREGERRELLVRIDRTEVKAPVAGIVSRRTAKLGAVAMSGGDALFRIITDGAIDLDAEVPEQSMARLAVGMEAKLKLPGATDEVVGHVRLISEEVDKATRIGKVRIALPPGAPARIGSFASGVAILARRPGVAVPTSALQRADDGDFVQVVKDERVDLRKVTIGITNARESEVREGLAAGETVVVRAGAFLRAGDVIRPVSGSPQAKAAATTREASR